ncbi:MAG TPA: biotin--[acetyl-CoA-carboxylase] ligase [Chitinophagaceae bacterium]
MPINFQIYSDEFVRTPAVVHSSGPLYLSTAIFAKNSNLLSSPSQTRIIGHPFLQLARVDSTNNYAMAQIHNGLAVHGATWFTRLQTAGKGQRGKHWNASEGMNLLQSTAVDASVFSLAQPFVLTAIVANACYEFFSKYAGSETSIKWPNDIYWRDRKAGGVLIENIIRGNSWTWAVVGIGININQTSFMGLPNPVSLKQITGSDYDTAGLGRELCSYLDRHYNNYLSAGFDAVFRFYNEHLYCRNKNVRLQKGDEQFTCTINGVDERGDLLVENCGWKHFSFGEVEWIIGS